MEPLAGLLAVDGAEHKLGDARARIDARLRADPDNPDLLLIAARTYAAAQDLGASEAALRKVIQAKPDNFTAYGLLGQVYLAERRLPEALVEFDRLASKQPDSIAAHTMAAMIVHTQNKLDEARKRYEKILEIDSRAPVAANNLAWILADSGENLDRALQLARSAAERIPNQPEVIDTVGWVYYKKQLGALAVPQFSGACSSIRRTRSTTSISAWPTCRLVMRSARGNRWSRRSRSFPTFPGPRRRARASPD